MPTQREAVQHYRQAETWSWAVIEAYQDLAERIETLLGEVRTQAEAARHDLAVAYLPELSAEALQRAEALTGFRGFTRRRPLDAMAHEAKALRRAITTTEADERYVRRTYLVGPNGTLTAQLAEAASMLEPWLAECARFEDHEGFGELIEVGYDTPGFTERFWEARYWRHWATGDRITAALGMDDFGDDVLPAYRRVAEERSRWQAEVDRITAQVDEVHRLVQLRDQSEARLPQLPEIYLAGCHRMLTEFLAGADHPLLEQWCAEAEGGPDRAIQHGNRRCAGLSAKVAFLEEMLTQGIEPQQGQVEERLAKHQRKAQKFLRPKYRHLQIPTSHLDLGWSDKHEKHLRRTEQLGALIDRLMAYDRYERFPLTNDPALWWVEMTSKRPSRLTPRLRSWYDRHPNRTVALEPDDVSHAVAAAAAARPLDDVGYIS